MDLNAQNMYGSQDSVFHFTGDQTAVVLVPATAGKRTIIWDMEFSAKVNAEFQLQSDITKDLGCKKWFSPRAGVIRDMGIYSTDGNKSVTFTSVCAGPHSIAIKWTQV